MTSCSIPGCTDPIDARGWCKAHYLAWHKQHRCNAAACNRLAVDGDFCKDHQGGVCKVHQCSSLGQASRNGLCPSHFKIWERNNGNGSSRQFKGLGVLLCVTCHRPYVDHEGWPCPVWTQKQREAVGLSPTPFSQ